MFATFHLEIDNKQKKIIKQNKTVYSSLAQGKHDLEFVNEFNEKRKISIKIEINKTDVVVLDESFFSIKKSK